tara:strand:- start:1021 stop:2217 length:1197 start_codon:yes stop_codon:yes gene_type:complete
MRFNKKLNRLGTETAFEVSAQSRDWENRGHKVYPFHLGDINLKTPKSIRERTIKFINDFKNGYCPSEGIPELRDALAYDVGHRRNVKYQIDNVIVQPGGKPTIWKFLSVVMNKGDEVLYPNPGYPIYESQINYQGGVPIPYGYIQTKDGFKIDIDRLSESITEKTTTLIYNNYQNPISASSSLNEMEKIAEIAIANNLWVLSDDAYFEIRYTDKKPLSIVSIPGMKERTVILYTFSKKYAMTGWRLGASIGPKKIMKQIARFNVNDESCTNHFIQHAMAETLVSGTNETDILLQELKNRRDICVDGLNAIQGINIIRPESTFYLFPNISKIMVKKGFNDVEKFRKAALRNTGVSFCTRNHFGTPQLDEKEFFIRFAYSGIDQKDIVDGLKRLKLWIEG